MNAQDVQLFKALGDQNRMKVLNVLRIWGNKPISVSQIAHLTELKLSTVSEILQILFRAKVVSRNRQGKQVLYSIAHNLATRFELFANWIRKC